MILKYFVLIQITSADPEGVAMSLGRSVLKLLLVCLKDKVISIVLLSLWLYPPLNNLYFVLLNLLYIFCSFSISVRMVT